MRAQRSDSPAAFFAQLWWRLRFSPGPYRIATHLQHRSNISIRRTNETTKSRHQFTSPFHNQCKRKRRFFFRSKLNQEIHTNKQTNERTEKYQVTNVATDERVQSSLPMELLYKYNKKNILLYFLFRNFFFLKKNTSQPFHRFSCESETLRIFIRQNALRF